MKRSGFLYFLLIASALLIATPGCKKKPKGTTPIPGAATRPGVGDNATPLIDPGSTLGNNSGVITDANSNTGGNPLAPRIDLDGPQDREMFRANTIYFDLDRATIGASERPNIEAVANYMKANPSEVILIEGHCDERGTEGYNLSLGDRRALAAREYLINTGVSSDRIHTVSYGETRPAVDERNEAAYAKNRRAEFIRMLPAQ